MNGRSRVYSAADVELDINGVKFPPIVDLKISIAPPRRTSRIRVCALDDGPAARFAEMIARRLRLGEAWPLGLVDVAIVDHGQDVVVELTTKVRERDTGTDATIKRSVVVPTHLGDDFVLKKLADLLEEMVLHEVLESIFVDGALLRDPHRVFEFNLTVQVPVRAEEEK